MSKKNILTALLFGTLCITLPAAATAAPSSDNGDRAQLQDKLKDQSADNQTRDQTKDQLNDESCVNADPEEALQAAGAI